MKKRFFNPVMGLLLGLAICLGLVYRWFAGAGRIEDDPAAAKPTVKDSLVFAPAADNSSGARVEAPTGNTAEAWQIVRAAVLEEALHQQNLTDEDRDSIKALFHNWAMEAPKDAMLWAAAQWDDSGDQNLVIELKDEAGLAWAAHDFDSAFAWAASRRDAIYSDGLASVLLSNLAQSDPARAAAVLSQQTLEIMTVAAPQVLKAWAQTDPVAASGWVTASNLPADEIKNNLALIANTQR